MSPAGYRIEILAGSWSFFEIPCLLRVGLLIEPCQMGETF